MTDIDPLVALCVKGPTKHEALLEHVGERRGDAIESLLISGLVEQTKRGLRLTEAGKIEVDAWFARERARLGVERIDVLYESFCVINAKVKQIVTDWQLKPGGGEPVLNDHSDAAYDAAVIDRLECAADEFGQLLDASGAAGERLRCYRDRLARSLVSVRAGDVSFVASPVKDSFHTAWFELHEELIHLSGRKRHDEAVAGRG
jgi:pyruvate,orthophosphate dikinase